MGVFKILAIIYFFIYLLVIAHGYASMVGINYELIQDMSDLYSEFYTYPLNCYIVKK